MMKRFPLHIMVFVLLNFCMPVILITGCGPQQGSGNHATASKHGTSQDSTLQTTGSRETSLRSVRSPETLPANAASQNTAPEAPETTTSQNTSPEVRAIGAYQENSPDADLIRNIQYAEKFELRSIGDLVHLAVLAPWQNAAGARFNYLLGHDPSLVPDSLSNIPFIATPVKSTVIMSTTFIGFLDTLGVASTITGVSMGNNIFDEQLLRRYRSGEIREVGYDQQMNYELLLELDPDVVFLFGVQSGIVQTVNKLQNAGVPVVICADYLEPHPLGRAEWIKFFAAFYEMQELAATLFRDVSQRYNTVATSVAASTGNGKVRGTQPQETHGTRGNAPVVMLGLPWKDAWYVAGGASFAARLISDAGGNYLFSDHAHAEAKPYDIETVFSRAMQAEVWLNPGIATSLDEILEHDRRFAKLDVFSEGAIYNNNRRMGAGGGNDYWESGVVRPDLVLQDLVRICSDQAVNDNDLYYYRKLK